ncbi:MAG TPA: Flp pilus assembly protein CpaB [Candidatus Acidoferrales bacterium]|nr:Flp pilus assembly protein CpaB [Candidatus Acidoferrales bacterium]
MDRQKKLILFGAAWVSAFLLTWFLYAKAVAPQQEKMLRIVVAGHDMPLGTLLRPSDIKIVNYPERDVPKGVVFDAKLAAGRVILVPLNTNEPVLLGKLSAPTSVEGVASIIEPGYRAVSVSITDVSGVAGLIQPGSKVDVLFTRPGSMAEATTSTILQNVKVLSAGKTVQAGQAPDPKAPKSPVVTLVLTPQDAQKLELAKNEGKISLSLRNPLDGSAGAGTDPITTEVLDPMISARLARARRGRTTAIGKANLDDPNVWQELTGEKKPVDPRKLAADEEARRKKAESEKPKVVVDVFRGDKHTQETFK